MIANVVILAAGRGSRLGPLGAVCSKPMLPILGVPLIRKVLDTLISTTLPRVFVVISPEDSQLREYLGGCPFPIEIHVQPQPLGAAHALLLLKDKLSGPFLVSACDSLTSASHVQDLIHCQSSTGCEAVVSLLSVAPTQALTANSVVQLHGNKVIRIIEKPKAEERLSDVMCTPLYLLTPSLFSALETQSPSARGELEIVPAIQTRISQGAHVLGVFTPIREQITTVADLLDLNLREMRRISKQRIHQGSHCLLASSANLNAPLWLEDDVVVGEQATLGPLVYVGKGARIAQGAHLSECLVLPDTEISAGSSHHQQVLFPALRPAKSS